jgi:hypothetical protein
LTPDDCDNPPGGAASGLDRQMDWLTDRTSNEVDDALDAHCRNVSTVHCLNDVAVVKSGFIGWRSGENSPDN